MNTRLNVISRCIRRSQSFFHRTGHIEYKHDIQRCRCYHACIGCRRQCRQSNHKVRSFRLCNRNLLSSFSNSRKCNITVIYRLIRPDTSDILSGILNNTSPALACLFVYNRRLSQRCRRLSFCSSSCEEACNSLSHI